MTRVLNYLRRHAASLLFGGALLGLAAGLWMAWPPLALIVPSGLILALMAVSRLRGG